MRLPKRNMVGRLDPLGRTGVPKKRCETNNAEQGGKEAEIVR